MEMSIALYKVKLSKERAQLWSGHGTDDKNEERWYKVIEHEGSRIIVTLFAHPRLIRCTQARQGNRKATEKAQAQPQACELQQS